MIQAMRALAVGFMFMVGFVGVAQADHHMPKAGDTVHVCSCGPKCPCQAMQAGPGKCGCGKDLAKATVTKVEGDKVTVKMPDGAEQSFAAKK
jgi:hypothetical protein